jgi:hypothetical protein
VARIVTRAGHGVNASVAGLCDANAKDFLIVMPRDPTLGGLDGILEGSAATSDGGLNV